MKNKVLRIAKNGMKKTSKGGQLVLLDIRTYQKTTVIKSIWNWQRKRQKGQRKKNPEMDPSIMWAFIYDKGSI